MSEIITCEKCGTFYKPNLHVHDTDECIEDLVEIKRIKEKENAALTARCEELSYDKKLFSDELDRQRMNLKATSGTLSTIQYRLREAENVLRKVAKPALGGKQQQAWAQEYFNNAPKKALSPEQGEPAKEEGVIADPHNWQRRRDGRWCPTCGAVELGNFEATEKNGRGDGGKNG